MISRLSFAIVKVVLEFYVVKFVLLFIIKSLLLIYFNVKMFEIAFVFLMIIFIQFDFRISVATLFHRDFQLHLALVLR